LVLFGLIRQLSLLREEFRQLKLILHSELRRRAASCRAFPCPSSFTYFTGRRIRILDPPASCRAINCERFFAVILLINALGRIAEKWPDSGFARAEIR